jgi:uncharacterized protein YPO0396
VSKDQRSLFPPEQFRISQLQVFNWGTFSNLHDIPIAPEGFLFVGNSGSGKSTILDAISAILIPPKWVDFNAAARESEAGSRDRNVLSYVRGAWSEQQNESGEFKTQCLRRDTTWSALALVLFNQSGRTVTLVQLFWIQGPSTANEDVKRCFLIFEKPFDLRSLSDFGQSNFDIAQLKTVFPDAYIRREFSQYCERFCRLLGIENESALRLLHRTQSAKNLGDLNTFLRTFMLEPPKTFEVAKNLVEEFTELNSAHQEVVTARDQIAILSPARELFRQREAEFVERNALGQVREHLEAYRNHRRADLLKQELSGIEAKAAGLAGEVSRREGIRANELSLLLDLEEKHRAAGGDSIERWESEKQSIERQIVDRLRRKRQVEAACTKLGWELADDPIGYGRVLQDARQESEAYQSTTEALRQQSHEIYTREATHTEAFARARKEVEVLRRNTSNIPEYMIGLRAKIAAAIGVSEEALPFVGELIEVKPEEAEWTGAAERVLRNFALSMLTDDRHYADLANYVNRTNLGQRLVYYRTHRVEVSGGKYVGLQSLFQKLNFKDSPHGDWLRAELRQRFDYMCVNSAADLRNTEKAVTREGQVKHSRSMHEKDDRRSIDDRRNWVLGFDSREKLAVWEKEAQRLAVEIAQAQQEARNNKMAEEQKFTRFRSCESLINTSWEEIDAHSLSERVATLVKLLSEAREGNVNLRLLAEQIAIQKKRFDEADRAVVEAKANFAERERQWLEHQEQLEGLNLVEIPQYLLGALEARYTAIRPELNLITLDPTHSAAQNRLSREIEEINQRLASLEKEIEKIFASFLHRWVIEAEGVQPNMASAGDFFAKLTRLEADNLPAYEERFFDLLQRQSHQHLAALSTYLRDDRKEIRDRMDYVNENLAKVPFNRTPEQTTYLRIQMTDKLSEDVREFRQNIQKVLENSLTEDGTVDRSLAEERFKVLRDKIVARLASQELEDRHWRENVLDVRLHIEFVGREIDENGHEVEVHRSGSGKSGGQRQKFATTCLAAALCYQLGANLEGTPIYAPVVLDEAFGKQDAEFTATSIGIFKNFGFQVLFATPFQKVMTIEPFVGGACLIDISDRQTSGVLNITYDRETKKLKFPKEKEKDLSYENAR